MRNFIHCFVVVFCVLFTFFFKILLDDSFDDFLTIKLLNIKTLKAKAEVSSLTEALKKRFFDPKNNTPIENLQNCPIRQSNHTNYQIYKEKFSKLSRNFLIGKNLRSKYFKILNLANNYLAFNQTHKPKTGILNVY